MRKYILYSTLIGIFSDAAAIYVPVNIRLFYFIVILNLAILVYLWDLTLPKYYLLALAYLCISGFLEVSFGPDRLSLYLKEVLGITLMSFYFYLFFRTSRYSVVKLFDLYAQTAFWMCLFGIFLAFAETIVLRRFIHVKSILAEPANFAIIMMPAFYYYASIKRTQKQRLYMWTILTAIILSVSSTGMLGLLLATALLLRRKSWGLFFAPFALGLIFLAAYVSSEHFRMRVDDTMQSASSVDVSKANLSTYALVSNAYVAARAIQERPFFGYGVGGHIVAHQKYIDDLPGVESVGDLIDLNAPDANSLFLRTMSEFGIAGIVLIGFFLVKFWTSGDSIYTNIGVAAFVYFCMILLRAGQWFDSGIYFFVWTYVLIHAEARKHAAPALARVKKQASPSAVYRTVP